MTKGSRVTTMLLVAAGLFATASSSFAAGPGPFGQPAPKWPGSTNLQVAGPGPFGQPAPKWPGSTNLKVAGPGPFGQPAPKWPGSTNLQIVK